MIFIYLIQLYHERRLPILLSLMCQIIDQDIFSSEQNFISINALQKYQQRNPLKTIFQEDFCLIRCLKNNCEHSFKYKAFTMINSFDIHHQLLIEIHYSDKQYFIKAKSVYNNKLVSVQKKQMRKNIGKQLTKNFFTSLFQYNTILFNIENGEWYIKSPIIHSNINNIKQLKKIYLSVRNQIIETAKATYKHISNFFQQRYHQISQQKKNKLTQILRYYTRCTIEPSISVQSECAEYGSVISRYLATGSGLDDLINQNKRIRSFTKDSFQSLSIYGLNYQIDRKSQYLDEITLHQKQKIQKDMLIPPLIAKNQQNKFVFNLCYFYKKNYPQKLIAQSCNSQIYALKPQIYQYTSSTGYEERNFEKIQILSHYATKHIVYKKITKQSCLAKANNQNCLNRQNQIIPFLRGGSCMFLPKYYRNIQKSSQYENKLFMDYLVGDTLDQYIESNSETISFITKLYMLLQILQGLRFIHQFGVVHLDIKQKNIIVLKRIVCKIFDFGQSYHFKLCGTSHKPSYTKIYGSPQAVTCVQGRVFTQKSDIFSLGIMMHNIILGRYPYNFGSKQQFQKYNFGKQLRQRTLYCAQQSECLGYKNIIGIINQIILKCIDMQQNKRPYLDWLALVLKNCLNYLTTQ